MMAKNMMAMAVGLHHTSDLDGEPVVVGVYGKEVILDCYWCDPGRFNRRDIRICMDQLVKRLKMKKGPLHFWDDVGVRKRDRQTKLETTGTSAIQFILTSNITLHCLDKLSRVYVNIFSCKDFDEGCARAFISDFFKAHSIRIHVIYRQ
jgi:S-adenosylmethionine/arginine decarboxylase-like enzyme